MKKTITLFIFLLTLIGIVAGFHVLKSNTETEDEKETKVSVDLRKTEEDISVSMSIKGEWTTRMLETPYAAEYDFVIFNKTDSDIIDWRMEIKLPKEYNVEGLWNGNYTVSQDDILKITPMEYNHIIKAGDSIPVGFIVDSLNKLSFKEVNIYYKVKHDYTEKTEFIFLIVASVIWSVAMLIFIAIQIQNRMYTVQRRRQESIITQTMNVISSFVDSKDSYTNGHSKRVAFYSKELARRLRLSETEVNNCFYAAMLHDCGKIIVPDHILNKEEKLTSEEDIIMQNHTICGAEALEKMTVLPMIREGALYHHERYDGTGYPEKKKGTDIPLVARIISVADSFDAMYTDRCYRLALEKSVIIGEFKKNAGSQFDPTIVSRMIEMIEDGYVDTYSEDI